MAKLEPGADRVDAALDLLWAMMEGPAFVAWTELWVAARTEPDLQRAIVAVNDRFLGTARQIFAELFADDGGAATDEFFELGLALPLSLMDGMALSRFHDPYQPYPTDRLLQALKDIRRLVYPR
jgi:hypothetical protein